jgi:hypothetical protein
MPKKYAKIYNDNMSETTNKTLNDPTHEKNVSLMETKKYQMETKKYQHFFCENCNYSTTINSNYEKHKNTKKHLDNVGIDTNSVKCECSCGRLFANRSGLWKHKPKCGSIIQSVKNDNGEVVENKVSSDLFLQAINRTNELQQAFLEENRELQNKLLEKENKLLEKENYIIEQNNKLLELSSKPTYNTINNNQFNLNVYLNETCKDAMNIVDFVNSLKLTIEDFETTGRLGFVDGISRIIIKELKNLDTEKMPIHCTDLKRETLYIKDNDKWEKENDEKRRFKWAINRIAQLNLNQLQNWQLAYPESIINNTPANEKFTELALVALGGRGEEQENKFREKIMKNVLKEVVLDKKSMVK